MKAPIKITNSTGDFIHATEWLTEELLGEFLKDIYPYDTFIHDEIIPNSGRRFRPDYRCDKLMIIVEFDGHHHYTNPANIISDRNKDALYSSMGYTVIRIPYFVQIDVFTVEYFFKVKGAKLSKILNCPHGFHSKNVVTPANFCTAGYDRYKAQMIEFDKSGMFCEWLIQRVNYVGFYHACIKSLDLFDPDKDAQLEFGYGWPT